MYDKKIFTGTVFLCAGVWLGLSEILSPVYKIFDLLFVSAVSVGIALSIGVIAVGVVDSVVAAINSRDAVVETDKSSGQSGYNPLNSGYTGGSSDLSEEEIFEPKYPEPDDDIPF